MKDQSISGYNWSKQPNFGLVHQLTEPEKVDLYVVFIYNQNNAVHDFEQQIKISKILTLLSPPPKSLPSPPKSRNLNKKILIGAGKAYFIKQRILLTKLWLPLESIIGGRR